MNERAPLIIPPGTEVRGFLTEQPLGAGGFGTVYRARRGEKLYALKFIRCREAGGWAKREVENLLRVTHRNVVAFEGCGFWPDDTKEYLVVFMDYVDGQRLDVWAQEENPDAEQVAHQVLGLAQALAAIHRAHVIHRDLKEANIIIRAADGEAVLVDFGVAGGRHSIPATREVLPPCTPEYRAPEAWRFLRSKSRKPGERYEPGPGDDLYALGVVFYWLLTGCWPCVGATVAEQAEATLYQVPEPPHDINPRVPQALGTICMKLLEKLPENRYADALTLQAAVEEALARVESAWRVPLCDPHAPDNTTTQGVVAQEEDIEAVDHWLRMARHAHERPRRGKRPLAPAVLEAARLLPPVMEAAPVLANSPAPEPAAAAPAQVEPPGVPASTVLPRDNAVANGAAHPLRRSALNAPLRVGVGVGLVGLGVAWLGLMQPRPAMSPPGAALLMEGARVGSVPSISEVTWAMGEPDRKVAPPGKPPEALRREFFIAEAEPALLPASMLGEKGEASVKQPQQRQQKGLGSVGKMVSTGLLCSTLACTGPQVRPEPPAEECPPGAVETMAELGIRISVRSRNPVFLPGPPAKVISVREGWTSVEVSGRGFKKLPVNAIFKGRLLFGGERVYGRLTEAQDPEDSTRRWRVCMELLGVDRKRGLEMEPGSTADTAKVFNSLNVEAVDRFE
jgi:eukaryotic-like serine/threonine-protein kinase